MPARKPQPASKRRRKLIGDELQMWARIPYVRDRKPLNVPNHPFYISKHGLHPPEAVPPKEILAQDAAPNAADFSYMAWAGSVAMTSAFQEGMSFLGYPYLAEIAQRPEYRRVSEIIATEMTRKWIKLQSAGDQDKTAQIKELEDFFEYIKVRDIFRQAAEQDGFFGRSHIYLDTGDTDNWDELKTPMGNGWDLLSKVKVNPKHPVQMLRTVEAVWVYPLNYNSNDPLRDDWYKPRTWFVLGKQMHATRLLTLIGREVPDLLKPAYSFGGLSLSQMVKPYVDNWLRTRQSVADLIHAFSVFVLSTELQAQLQDDNYEQKLDERVDFFNRARDNKGLMLLNKATEDLKNISAPLGTLDNLQAQTQEHMAAVTGIPLVKLLGIQPAGLNASSEGEIRVFYDWIAAYQRLLFNDALHKVLGFAMLSLWGKNDPDISFDFESLWALDEAAEANVRKTEAETDIILIDGGVISPQESRTRVANQEDSPYASLDVFDMPQMPGVGEEGGPEDIDLQGALESTRAPEREAREGVKGMQEQQQRQQEANPTAQQANQQQVQPHKAMPPGEAQAQQAEQKREKMGIPS